MSQTIWIYLHSFSRYCVLIVRNQAKFRENSELIAVQGHPRSSTLVPIEGAYLCNFLFIINSNFGHISYRFQDIDAQKAREQLVIHTRPLFDALLGPR